MHANGAAVRHAALDWPKPHTCAKLVLRHNPMIRESADARDSGVHDSDIVRDSYRR